MIIKIKQNNADFLLTFETNFIKHTANNVLFTTLEGESKCYLLKDVVSIAEFSLEGGYIHNDSDAIIEDIRTDEVFTNIDMRAMIHHQIYIVEDILAGDLTNESRIEHTIILKDLKEELNKYSNL